MRIAIKRKGVSESWTYRTQEEAKKLGGITAW